MNKFLIILSLLLIAVGCKTPEARRPVSQNTGSYINQSIARNKKLNKAEEKAIKSIINEHPEKNFIASENGFWYYYNIQDTLAGSTPQVGDLVSFNYNISTLNGTPILTKEEIGDQTYQIDQSNQELMSGLRDGLKLMKPGETVTFLFPSHKAYGYYGFQNKIGSNLPIQSQVTLNEIQPKNSEN